MRLSSQRTKMVAWLLLAACGLPAIGSTAAVRERAILVITSHTAAPYVEMSQAFREHLREQRLPANFLDISLDGNRELPASSRETIDSSKIALIYCLGGLACTAAKAGTADVPTVAGLIVNAEDIVRSGNSTGVVLQFPVETQLEWLQRLLPHHRTIGVVYNEQENQATIEAARIAARKFNIELVAVGLRSPRELPAALEAVMRRVDVLWGIPDSMVLSPSTAKAILLASFQNRVPFVGISTAWVKAGALFALDWDYRDMGVQTAEMASTILRGRSVAKVPVTPPRKIRYALNVKTAEHMKIRIPSELIREASQVIR